MCFWAVGLQPSYFSWFFRVFLQKHCFSPEKGLFWFISRCLPFVLLGFFHVSLSLSLSLSLSISLLLSYFSLPCCLVFIFTFLVFWLFFVVLLLSFYFMKKTTSKYYICKFDFHKLFLCFLICLSQICSYICFSSSSHMFWCKSMFFKFPRRPSKHQFGPCTL